MAYIPPHKRHVKDDKGQGPTPEVFTPQFRKNLNLRPSGTNKDRSGKKIVYSNRAVSRWFALGLDENDKFPSSVELKSISMDQLQRPMRDKSLILVNSDLEAGKPRENNLKSPWDVIAENVQQDLLSSFDALRNELEDEGLEKVKPTLVARFGKMRFHDSPSVKLENVQKDQVMETILRQLKRSIYTNIPASYMEHIVDEVVPNIGIDFEEEKDIYHVRLFDNRKPDSTISCKCTVLGDKKLVLYKVKLNQVRHMMTDISCLEKNLDLRIMLCTKRILTALTANEMDGIRNLINLAVLDPDAKGGLRWPLGMNFCGDRYSVVGVWHSVAKAYKNPSVRLKVRHADRFDFTTGNGEVTREIYLKLKGITSELLEQGAKDEAVVMDMFKDSLKLIWNNFMCCEPFLTE